MKRVGDVLSAIFDENLLKKAKGYSAFFSCWKDLTEKNGIAAAADHTWIKSLERGLVWIEVDHPGWKQILQTKESKLLSDLRCRFPEMDISGISIMLSRDK
jgi:predicted nucleic acid-binding Zn ribbon protein